jgi:hypothetical protein
MMQAGGREGPVTAQALMIVALIGEAHRPVRAAIGNSINPFLPGVA